ncbi:acyl-ACP--UDP-N-acetylglucosamine O-acyltransferase [Salinisphaera sp.]|uniref:acyl-ACP--UDP-N-acetylglucosamine O-acyltransferase n=1 Tax=Salinisphaera sp. TaxID=1914330 RepID=UPI000C3DE39F|nr:acyl-ACP--UDP-N-acetylglucosamine O-acyltransferase [Salinisphaera sp.]MAS11121.1 acyl-[acyl-carrier-protein]--UDP-N-acetylglucosamine O-acyltransferase [Salinisphaera sp.]|tara:strand:+ start:299 stop:1072 length:774 start_codon:yes stop_codon:yes gene_type:complete
MPIDPSAQVHPEAQIADDVDIGPFSVIGPHVKIGAGSRIGPHVVISGHTTIGRENNVFQFVSLGAEPQHRVYAGEPTRLTIGDRNTFREYCSVHRGTTIDQSETIIGDDNLLMAYTHVAHDCVLGNGITMANGASLAGHVRIGDYCILAGFALVYQFRRVGTMAFLAYCSGVQQDVPAFVRSAGAPAVPHGINSVGMRRRGYSEEEVAAAKRAYRTIYRSKLRLEQARDALREPAQSSASVQLMLESLEQAERGIIR